MKRNETPSNGAAQIHSSRRHRYTKVLDNRKHAIRGLWRRNGKFLARITVEDEAGRKDVRWLPLAAKTAAEAQEQLRTVMVERTEHRLRHIGRSPLLAEYMDETYLPLLAGSGKKPATIITEQGHYRRWRLALGHLRLDKIKPSHIQGALAELRARRSPRTCNIALVCLRHVLKAAKRDGFIKSLPYVDIEWQKTETKSRRLHTLADIERVCEAGLKESRNGEQLADYLHFLSLTGAREQEALHVRWCDVDFEGKLATIGADGDTKNREARRVDFNPQLETHLREMFQRRAPDSRWLFPSPQRGDRDEHAKTFRESLRLARKAAGLDKFGFHDCRHCFVSMCVMSGVDFMTVARWVGHKDGGVLIGKVYGHVSNAHMKAQALRVNFAPVIVEAGDAVARNGERVTH